MNPTLPRGRFPTHAHRSARAPKRGSREQSLSQFSRRPAFQDLRCGADSPNAAHIGG